MANHSKLWVALFLSLLMIGLAQTSYVTVDEEIIETFSESDETISKSSPLNLSSGYNPKTFADDAIFFDSVRAESVSVGFRSSCIVYDDQSLTCTGYNNQGLLGVGFATPSPYLEKEHIKVNFPEPVKVSQVEVGYDSTCAIDIDGGLWCWGYNNHGQSGTGSPESYVISPEKVLIDENESVSEVAIGYQHMCALTDSKKIYCWGNNNYGQSLLPHSGSVNVPTEVNLDSEIIPVSISGKMHHTCILNQNGAVYCWGQNNYGQLGDGTTNNRNEMIQSILPSSDPAVYLVAGYMHTCALHESGEMRCWGRNNLGQLGVKSNTPNLYKYPTKVLDLPLDPISFDLGYEYTCALLKTQTSICWGQNTYGQLGDATVTGFNTNSYNGNHKQVLTNYNSQNYENSLGLSVGYYTTCSVFDTGRVACWGYGGNGQIGDGATSSRTYPYYNRVTVGEETSDLLFPVSKELRISPFVDGINYSVSVTPSLPYGFALESETGAIVYDGTGSLNTSFHNLTFTAGEDEVTIPVSITVKESLPYPSRVRSHLGGLSLLDDYSSGGVMSISSTKDHVCINQESGEIHCWGDGLGGKLATNADTDQSTPQSTSTSVSYNVLRDIYYVATATEHNCALTNSGEVYCWGEADDSRLGHSSTTDSKSPVLAPFPNHRSVEMIATHESHNCAITDDGSVYCWGNNTDGQIGVGYKSGYLGNPTKTNLPDGSMAVAISVGDSFSCAVLSNASVTCWGGNDLGQLGDGTNTNSTAPGSIVQLSQDAVTVSSGQSHSCAILQDGKVACWGNNDYGQLGDGTLIDKNSPVIAQLPSSKSAVMIDVGISHTCAVMSDGSLYCWGLNANHQLADGTNAFKSVPIQSSLPNGISATLVTAGEGHTCILTNESTIYCIGANSEGQLGDSTTVSRTTFTETKWNQNNSISSLYYTLGYATENKISFTGWGDEYNVTSTLLPAGLTLDSEKGVLMYNGMSTFSNTITIFVTDGNVNFSKEISMQVFEHNQIEGRIDSYSYDSGFGTFSQNPVSVRSGYYHGCLIDYDHKMKCWGINNYGQNGYGSTATFNSNPVNVYHNYMTESKDMDVGTYQSCSIDNESQLWCWGYNGNGQLGVGDVTMRTSPIQVEDISNVLQVSVGQYLACALDSSWDVYCWGQNNQGQAGDSSLSNQLRPNLISGLGDSRPTMVSAGDSFACSLIENGSVACWGANNLGQLGIGSTVQSYEQIQWPNLPQGLSVSSISVGSHHACAIMDDYSLYCWGSNSHGQIGVGNTTDILSPTQILDSSYEVVGVTTGVYTTCSWLRNGSALCWGYNPYGNLGNGNTTQMDEPAWVRPHSQSDDMKIITMHLTLYNTCAMYDNGAISCWGQGQTYYANGDGGAGNSNYPQSFVYNQYTGQRYDGSGSVVSNLNYLEGYPRDEKLQNIGWNSNSSVSGVMPNGLSYNSTTEILSYDGSALTPGNFNIQITDDFGSRNLQVSYSSVNTNSKEGRIDSAWLGNASFNSVYNKDYQQIVSIDNSEQHTCILELDGDVLCWGLGNVYQLGNGGTTSYNYPFETSVDNQYPNLNFSSISTGDAHTCALDSESELLCWGQKAYYRLGDNSASGTRTYPYKYTGDSEVYGKELAMVSSGGEHTCAIRADATTWCWGFGNYGQTGDGSVNSGTQPKQVQLPNNLSATSLSLGYSSTCAIVDTGDIYCWGRNHVGQLGIGNTTDQSLPLKVLLPSGRTALALESGDYHACAILDDYSVKCWGQNSNGQIGDGTTDDRTSPASVILSGVNDPIQLSAGQSSTCAVFDNGRIKCWGLNSNGELGIGNQNQQNSPQDLNSISHLHASHVTVGNAFACATFHDGAPRCWGNGGSGKLGTGSTSSSNVPVAIREYAPGNITIIEGSDISIPLTVAGWDYTTSASGTYPTGVTWDNLTESILVDSDLQVGNYTISVTVSNSVKSVQASIDLKVIERIDKWSDRVESHSLGMSVLSKFDTVPVELSIGNIHSCFITNSSNYCQGYNTNGQLGENSYSQRNTPYEIYGFYEPLASISSGNHHTCGIDESGELYCWGYNSYGQIGNGANSVHTKYSTPREISIDYSSNQLPPALQISTGGSHSCGIFEDSNLYCWGYNNYGQLGLGDVTLRNRPVVVQTPGDDLFTDISLGFSHSCGIIKNGSAYCWGYNDYGQLGDSTNDNSNVPVYSQIPSGSKAVAISAGYYHNCAIMDNSSVYCWGRNSHSQLGNGNQTNMNIPVHVNLPIGSNPVQISSSVSHTCTVMDNGSMYCWGHNDYDQVEGPVTDNLGSYVNNPTYVSTKFNHRVVSVGVGEGYTCIITEHAAISCWGAAGYGKLVGLNENKISNLRYVISEEYEYSIQPMGWNIEDYSISNLPQGMTMNESKLSINSEANQTGSLSWIVNTTLGTTQGTIDYEAMSIDRRPSSAPAWTNSISYKEDDSAVSMTSVDAWYSHACGIDENGKVYCWGANGDGQLGDLSTNRRSSPNPVRFSGDDPVAIQVSTSRHNSCILTDEGRVMCWGDGSKGQNGQGTWDTDTERYDLKTPGEVLLPWSSNAVMISTGYQFACSLLDDGTVYCWGHNSYGQLGDGTTTSSGLPKKVMLPDDRFAISIDTGNQNSCAVLDNGEMYCWGRQQYGNMGTGQGYVGTTSVHYKIKIPIKVEIPQSKSVSFMGVGESHGCAVMTDNTLWCWGHNSHGEVGVGNESSGNNEVIRKPIQIDMQFYSPIIAIDLGLESTCTLHDDGSLNCWGENDDGEIGNGLIGGDTSSPVSIQLDGGVTATGITSGYRFKCATASDGIVQCWGYNSDSALGDGTQEPSAYPQVVDMDMPSTSTTLTYLEGEITQNQNYVSGWNYTFSVSPPLPQGFALDYETGSIMSIGNSTFGVSRHNVSAMAGPYTTTVEITIAVIRDTDGDGTPDAEDYDDDDDGNLDSLDNCPSQSGTSTLGGYVGCPDSDGDGWADLIDPFDDDSTQWKDTDGDGYGDNPDGTTPDIWILDSSQWFDTDGDGYGDNEFGTRGDTCPTEEGYSTIDVYGCIDSDSDGWSDSGDSFPFTNSQWADRDGDGWGDNQSQGAELVDIFPSDGTQWNDTDGDGHGDNKYGTEGDWFPNDPDRWADSDRDGVADEDDDFVNDATQSSDRDGDLYGDDPLGNRADEFPDDPTEWKDTDGDGVGNNADAFPFDPTQTTDRDGDGYGDNPLGSGADIFPDNPTQWEDDDEDGLGDNLTGTDADPFLNDFDNDGYNDSIDVLPKLYSPGDLDNDGYLDDDDWAPRDYREWADFDDDGKGDNEDPDDDNDGYADTDEIRQKTDPYDDSSVPVESFEIVVPGTSVGLGAWDLIGMFGGIPLFSWILFGFVTRNKRCAKFENMLNEARSRDELEQVALKWEYSLMLRLLGPHQGIRLERIRSELDDVFEKYEDSMVYPGEDQTQLVEKIIPEIRHTIEREPTVVETPVQPAYSQPVEPVAETAPVYSQPVEPVPETAPVYSQPVETVPETAPVYSQPVETVPENIPAVAETAYAPSASTAGTVGTDGYEWLTDNGQNYYRLANSGSEWTLWQG